MAMVTRITTTFLPEAEGAKRLKALGKKITKLRSRTVRSESLVEEWFATRKQTHLPPVGESLGLSLRRMLIIMPLKRSVNRKLE